VNNPPKKPPLASYLSDTQWRRRAARIRYEIESAFREEGFGDPALIYDEEKDFFRFAEDGVFAFSLGSTPTGGSSGGGGGCTSSRPALLPRRGPFSSLFPGPMRQGITVVVASSLDRLGKDHSFGGWSAPSPRGTLSLRKLE
jgi:hypothetical protein